MRDRFTRKSRVGRGKIPREMRQAVFQRDGFTCQFCGMIFSSDELTIDHLVPLSQGGLDEMINYVTACMRCNARKANTSLTEFASSIDIRIEELPVHGDPVIDNQRLPLQIRLVRRRIVERMRIGELNIAGRSAQKKIEKEYRRAFWNTPEGKELEAGFPSLPGHVRIMMPEIQTIAKDAREFLLLVELAKSANTRNLIGSVMDADCDVEQRARSLEARTNDEALKTRLQQALNRFEKEIKRKGW